MKKIIITLGMFACFGVLAIANAASINNTVFGKIINNGSNAVNTTFSTLGLDVPQTVPAGQYPDNVKNYTIDYSVQSLDGHHFVTYMDSEGNGCIIQFSISIGSQPQYGRYSLYAQSIGDGVCKIEGGMAIIQTH